jgi:hypothetical protein
MVAVNHFQKRYAGPAKVDKVARLLRTWRTRSRVVGVASAAPPEKVVRSARVLPRDRRRTGDRQLAEPAYGCLLSDSMPELFTIWVAAARAMSPPQRSVWELVKEEIDGGNFAIPDDYEISSGIGWRPARAARSRTLQHERHPSFLEALAERGALRAEVQNSCRERGMLG